MGTNPATVIYLHGFTSSPQSKKGTMFARRFEARGVPFRIPDLNVPDFEHLTLTAMLHRTAEVVRACPTGAVYLMGSSMGGLVAVHFLDRYRETDAARVEKLLLLAPALDFNANRQRQLGDQGLAEWRRSGWLDVYHYGYDAPRRLHYGLVEDIAGYDSFGVLVSQPTLIYHGTRDASVDYRQSVRYAEPRPNAELRLIDSDHELLDQIDTIWQGAVTFFGV